MGMKVHVCTKHIVEYGKTEGFNYTHIDFKYMLEMLGCDYTGDIAETDWEVERDKFNDALAKIKKYKAEIVKAAKGEDVGVIDEIDFEDVATYMRLACNKNADTFSESDVDEVINLMERYEAEGEPGSSYLNFSAF